MQAAVATTGPALAALWPDWTELWRHCPDATPFQSPAWLRPWWDEFGTGQPRVAVLRADDRLLGVLPLYRLDEPGGAKLLPMGAGVTDLHDALLSPEAPADAADRLLAAALAAGDGVPCDLPDLPPGAALRAAAAPPGWRAAWREDSVCPVLHLAEAADPLRAAIPAGLHRKLRMNRNRAARLGGAALELATPATAPALLDALVALHQARWQRDGGAGVLADPAVLDFHRAAIPGLAASGMLRLGVLRVGGRIAAASYAMTAGRDRLLFYLTGYDPGLAAVSPGNLLLAEMIEAGLREGRREMQFLRGEEAYKFAWGAQARCNLACRLVPDDRPSSDAAA
jgi:CelD/BcsL family acetyltransferase involved in cellulose biosynthesis